MRASLLACALVALAAFGSPASAMAQGSLAPMEKLQAAISEAALVETETTPPPKSLVPGTKEWENSAQCFVGNVNICTRESKAWTPRTIMANVGDLLKKIAPREVKQQGLGPLVPKSGYEGYALIEGQDQAQSALETEVEADAEVDAEAEEEADAELDAETEAEEGADEEESAFVESLTQAKCSGRCQASNLPCATSYASGMCPGAGSIKCCVAKKAPQPNKKPATPKKPATTRKPNAPIKKTTAKTPANKTPVKKTPIKKTPVKKTPIKTTPIKKTPVKKTPVKKTPLKTIPKPSTPARKPATKTTAKKASTIKTPVSKTTKAPVSKAPVSQSTSKCSGRCQASNLPCATSYASGMCPGSAHMQCCLSKAPVSKTTSKTPVSKTTAKTTPKKVVEPVALPPLTLTGVSKRIRDPRLELMKKGHRMHWGDFTATQQANVRLLVKATLHELPSASVNQIAYVIGTANWECLLQPISEWGGRNTRYAPYYGRGFVQLTWEDNYRKMTALLLSKRGITANLVEQPNLALDPENAAFIAAYGMVHGTFTGKKLSHYFNPVKNDWTNARRIINGLDKAAAIATLSKRWVPLVTLLMRE